MKVLIVGGGGREDALAWKLSLSERVEKVYAAPGNPGTARHAENVAIAAEDITGLRDFALKEGIDLTVVGPELPLTLGIADEFSSKGLLVFGPSKEAAELEGSKLFCKELMEKCEVPTAHYKRFTDATEAKAYIDSHSPPFVVKADGLAAGKGVHICRSRQEAVEAVDLTMVEKAYGVAGEMVIIEEFLEGEEASFIAITDGERVVPLAASQDHKQVYDGDTGPNTGGMGAYSPAPVVTPEMERLVMETVIRPVVRGMASGGRTYRGVLYAGLMVTADGPKVLEFNCRFGDPECQPLMMRLESDLFELLYSAASGELEEKPLEWTEKASVCVVMASKGYPGSYEKGFEITGLDEASKVEDVMVFHAGTKTDERGRVVNSGGRVLGVTALGSGVQDAIDRAYSAVDRIYWEGAYYRRDIGRKALNRTG